MAQLLVSVRSAAEAALAHRAGASIIDVKEPDAGPLGMSSWRDWIAVRQGLGGSVPVSVALGELSDWIGPSPPAVPPHAWPGLAFRKVGLAGSSPRWRAEWAEVREQLGDAGPAWIAVAYADWKSAGAPSPDEVLEAATESDAISGLLLDTWSKACPLRIDPELVAWSRRVRATGKRLAVAGGLDAAAIPGVACLRPDIVAVRGAACGGGDRRSFVEPERVAKLAMLVRRLELTPCRDD
ncbi:(5-formylfuran-3-yl)methyl phosphate synthase [Aquisphaera insulae]|uniref:(5-formylfuran-3-yl)methyl phosphate synthase n=1 Tax=Aquisphaera insulae TaxID=2712864 RepID=UPI0013EB5754|nr:(5-formylfuran-3-yl)methyl phosphate synthase [Aquisphaera insulae]